MPQFAVVIPSKESSNLLPCVSAIRKHEPEARIIVVDDGLQQIPEGVTVVQGVKPFIFPRAINMGVQSAIEQWPEVTHLICCNDDALLETPGGFTALAECSAKHPEFGVISATTNIAGNPDQYRRNVGLRQTHTVAYICVVIPRLVFEAVQWMDPRYCVDYGCCDRDHTEAITRAGLKVGVFDFCFVDHGSLHSSFRGDPEAPKDFSKNYALFRQKWGL